MKLHSLPQLLRICEAYSMLSADARQCLCVLSESRDIAGFERMPGIDEATKFLARRDLRDLQEAQDLLQEMAI